MPTVNVMADHQIPSFCGEWLCHSSVFHSGALKLPVEFEVSLSSQLPESALQCVHAWQGEKVVQKTRGTRVEPCGDGWFAAMVGHDQQLL
jgi:hypothetical protein